MISAILQILALILLAFALRRATKQDRISELALRDHIRCEVKNAAKVVISEVNSLRAIGLDNLNAFDRLLKEAVILNSDVKSTAENIYLSILDPLGFKHEIMMHSTNQANAVIDKLSEQINNTHKEVEFSYDSLSSSLITIAEKQLPDIIVKLSTLESPLAELIKAQAANTVKDGEARRTLYKRIKDRDSAIVNMQKAIEELGRQKKDYEETIASMKHTASSYLADLVQEITFIRSWMQVKGMPVTALDKAIAQEFKGESPSEIYHRIQNEKKLSATLNDPAKATLNEAANTTLNEAANA
ncbi:MAG: hypothetical protein PHY48_12820 [Candidatus Cloacimonetes bacterium]|nr:hypothetical protein [Candidatus Cloacimonadota bacterium]